MSNPTDRPTPAERGFRADLLLAEDDAYQILREVGVGADSSMSDVHLACQRAQQRRELSPARARAWTRLRTIEQRLLLDLLFFDLGAFAAGAAESQAAQPGPAPPPVESNPAVPPAPAHLLAQAAGVPSLPEPSPSPSPAPPSLDPWVLLAELAFPEAKPATITAPASFLEEEP